MRFLILKEKYGQENGGPYKHTIDPSRTRMVNVNGHNLLEFYSRYINSKGEEKEAIFVTVELLTKTIDKNIILFYRQSELLTQEEWALNKGIIKLDTGMNIKEAKKEIENMLIVHNIEMTYLNNEGKVKKSNVNVKTDVEIFETEKMQQIMKDEANIMTGVMVNIRNYILKESFPEDLNYWNDENYPITSFGTGTIEIACTGDITKTGDVDATDLSTMQEYLVDNIELEEVQQVAADMNDDDYVDVVDLSGLQEYISNQ